MCAALTVVLPTMRLGSVNENASRSRAVRAVLIAFRSSTMWIAFIPQSPPTRFGSVNVKGPITLKVAVTTVAPPRVTVQSAVPEQPPPLQPANAEPPSGIAVSVTTVPPTKLAEQIAPQVTAAGVLFTVPAPAPAVETVRAKTDEKVAVTVVAAETVAPHGAVPLHPPPLQPTNTEPPSGAAVTVTTVPAAKLAEQIAPQVTPAGVLVTVPAPAPAVATVRTTADAKVAVTVVAAETVTTHGAVPLHPPPLHPTNSEPPSGAAVSVTTVPLKKLAEQLEPQLMPSGVLVTVPVPALETVSVKVWSVKGAVIVVAAESVTVQASG